MNANVFLWVYHDMNALTQTQFIQKFPLFPKRGFLNAWNQNILKAWFIIPEKSSFFFDLRLLKNWWSLLEISEWGIDLESDDLAQEIYFHSLVEQKGWHVFKAFLWKNEFFKNQAS